MTVGICGMGRMGSAIARRLLSLGEEVVVWNRDTARTKPLAEAGARVAATPAALARECDSVITMLFDGPAVEAVYLGPGGLLEADLKGKLLIEMSTTGPVAAQSVGKAAVAAGASFVECPVGGSVKPAAEGKLLGLVGGSDEDVERARPILEKLCRRIEHAGPIGGGARLKLAINLPLLVYWQSLGEALALVADLDIAPERLADIFADTSGTPAAMKMRAGDVAALLAGEERPGAAFTIDGAGKDLAEMVKLAQALGTHAATTAAARDAFAAAIAEGRGDGDAITMATAPARAMAGK
jgi:3-hydroxyisobutyrate dehydrogenase